MPTPTAFTDAQAINDSPRNVRTYSDLDLFFAAKGVSKDISKVTDIQAVKRSVRNLILLNHYEKQNNITKRCFTIIKTTK